MSFENRQKKNSLTNHRKMNDISNLIVETTPKCKQSSRKSKACTTIVVIHIPDNKIPMFSCILDIGCQLWIFVE